MGRPDTSHLAHGHVLSSGSYAFTIGDIGSHRAVSSQHVGHLYKSRGRLLTGKWAKSTQAIQLPVSKSAARSYGWLAPSVLTPFNVSQPSFEPCFQSSRPILLRMSRPYQIAALPAFFLDSGFLRWESLLESSRTGSHKPTLHSLAARLFWSGGFFYVGCGAD